MAWATSFSGVARAAFGWLGTPWDQRLACARTPLCTYPFSDKPYGTRSSVGVRNSGRHSLEVLGGGDLGGMLGERGMIHTPWRIGEPGDAEG